MRANGIHRTDQHHGNVADERSAAHAHHAPRQFGGASHRGDQGRHGHDVRGRHAQGAQRRRRRSKRFFASRARIESADGAVQVPGGQCRRRCRRRRAGSGQRVRDRRSAARPGTDADAGRGRDRWRVAGAAPTRKRRRLFAPRRVTRDNLLSITRELATLASRRTAAGSRAGGADRPGADAAGGEPAADGPRRRPRRQVAVAGARRASHGVLALLRQHRPRRRGGRRARHRADPARRHDGADQGSARQRTVGADLSDDIDRSRCHFGDGAAGVRRAAVPADVFAGRQGAAFADADRHPVRHGAAQILVAGDPDRRRPDRG